MSGVIIWEMCPSNISFSCLYFGLSFPVLTGFSFGDGCWDLDGDIYSVFVEGHIPVVRKPIKIVVIGVGQVSLITPGRYSFVIVFRGLSTIHLCIS